MQTQLYLISPDFDDLAAFARRLEPVLAAAPVPAFQLRLKNRPEAAVIAAVEALKPICHAHDTAFILNDKPALAAQLDCDGVHIGREDGSVKAARAAIGADRQLGVSCYASIHRAMEAAEQGADYVAFGSVFPTKTKDTATPCPPDILAQWAEISTVPSVAIGGINAQMLPQLLPYNPDFVAVVHAVWGADDPVAALRALQALCMGDG